MKINKIYISAFGGLKDFTLELNDGLNVIYGNNEDGKSTVAAFIKAMFFGTGRSSKNLAESPRQKYAPWDGSPMAGRIYFEKDGKKYCLEREFRKSDSTDRILLTDLDSGKQIDAGENVGQQFFGLSAAAFERSLFIGNGDFIKDDTASSEINGKLSNIAVTGSEDVSYKAVHKNIFDTRTKIISKSGKSGSYNEDLQAYNALVERLNRADQDAKARARLNQLATEKHNLYETLYKKYTELKALIDSEQDFNNRQKLEEFLQTKALLDELNKSLTLSDGTIVNESFAQKVAFCLGLYDKSAERCEEIKKDIARIKDAIALQNSASPEDAKAQIATLTADISALNEQKANLEDQETAICEKIEAIKQRLETAQSKKAVFNIPLLILSILLIVSGPVLLLLNQPVIFAYIILILGASLGILSHLLRPNNTKAVSAIQSELAEANTALAQNKADKNRIQENINNINAQINNLSTVINTDAAVKNQRLADLAERNETLREEEGKLASALSEVLALLSGFEGIDSIEKAKTLLEEIKQKTAKQKDIKLQLKTASQFLGNIDYDEAQAKLDALQNSSQFDEVDFDAVKAQFEEISAQLDAVKQELTEIVTELKTSFRHAENPEELRRQIAELQERLEAKKAFCDSADVAMQVLEESFYELRRGFGSDLEKLTHSIFADLTDGKYKSVTVTDTLDISVEKADVFGTREVGYLSLGTTHQAYLSLRLAIASLIEGDSPLPVFLDDSLSQYDDTRAANTIAYLKKFCDNRQGIFFTCHNSICDIAKKQGIGVLKPYK